jgi:hypothetical protein
MFIVVVERTTPDAGNPKLTGPSQFRRLWGNEHRKDDDVRHSATLVRHCDFRVVPGADMRACRVSWQANRSDHGKPGSRPSALRIATVECVAEIAVWRPSSFTQYINGRTASREVTSRPLLGGLGDSKRKWGEMPSRRLQWEGSF